MINTFENKVRDRKLPECTDASHALAQLQDSVRIGILWMETMFAGDDFVLDRGSYDKATGIIYACLCTFAPQGRVGGIMDMRFFQGEELMTRCFATTTQFKTSSTFGVQAVIASDEFVKLLAIYLTKIRPFAVANRKDARTRVNKASDPLFLTFDGDADVLVGRKVKRYYRKNMGITTTTTGIRSLIETVASEKLYRGEITYEQRSAVSKINGHSAHTANDFYVQNPVEVDVAHALEVITGAPPDSLLQPRTTHKHAAVGTKHPVQDKHAQKVAFSHAELRYLQQCLATMDQGPFKFWARVLKRILSDPDAMAIFHLRHIEDSTRIRGGIRGNFVFNRETRRYEPILIKDVVGAEESDDESDDESQEEYDEEFE